MWSQSGDSRYEPEVPGLPKVSTDHQASRHQAGCFSSLSHKVLMLNFWDTLHHQMPQRMGSPNHWSQITLLWIFCMTHQIKLDLINHKWPNSLSFRNHYVIKVFTEKKVHITLIVVFLFAGTGAEQEWTQIVRRMTDKLHHYMKPDIK